MLNNSTIEKIKKTLEYQQNKYGSGGLADPFQFISILGEEFGEVCRAVNAPVGADVEKEVLQCITVCIAYLEGLLHYTERA